MRLAGKETKAALSVMTLPYSGAIVVQALPKGCTKTFPEGHRLAVEAFGGTVKRSTRERAWCGLQPRGRKRGHGTEERRRHGRQSIRVFAAGGPASGRAAGRGRRSDRAAADGIDVRQSTVSEYFGKMAGVGKRSSSPKVPSPMNSSRGRLTGTQFHEHQGKKARRGTWRPLAWFPWH